MCAVYESRLDADLKQVATAFAWFATDSGQHIGSNIRPSIQTVSRMTGLSERTLRRRLDTLRKLGVLELEDPERGLRGGKGKSTHYRFNMDVLARLSTEEPGQRCQGNRNGKPGQQWPPLREQTRPTVAANPVTGGHKPGQMEQQTRPAGADDPTDPTGTYKDQKPTGADAPDCSLGNDTENREPRFAVYAAIATDALTRALRNDKTDRVDHVIELFKQAWATAQPNALPYDGELARRAVDAALYARDKAAKAFQQQFQRIAGGRSMR